jgi:hypothetical protein
MTYPNDVDAVDRVVDGTTLINKASIDDICDTLDGVTGELGTLPKGAHATVKARLDSSDTSIATLVNKTQGFSWVSDLTQFDNKTRHKLRTTFWDSTEGDGSDIRQVRGDLEVAANAYFDGSNWQKFDTSRVSFMLDMAGQNDLGIPESDTAAVSIWVSVPGSNPIGDWDDKGLRLKWDWGLHFTQHANLAIYGKGLEVDGGVPGETPSGGYPPYGRFVHTEGPGGAIYTGTIENMWPDFGGRDTPAEAGYFLGMYNHEFRYMQITTGSSYDTKFSVNSYGEVSTPLRCGDGIGNNGVQYFKFPRLTTSQRNSLSDAIGMCIFNDDTNTLQLRKSGGWVTITHG